MDEYSAGAILYTVKDNEIYYLLIKDFNGNWGFPKGHLENGETNVDAALREIKEEVGIDAVINTDFHAELIYPLPNGNTKHSLYYIGKYENQIPEKQLEEIDIIELMKYEDAVNTINRENMRQAFIEADAVIRSLE